MTVLISGFEPFLTSSGHMLPVNPTAGIASKVSEKLGLVESIVLPVSFEQTPKVLLEAFERIRPNRWLGLGYAENRKGVEVEVVALNVDHSRIQDNDGELRHLSPIIAEAPLALWAPFDYEALVETLSACGIPAKISTSAGTFLCNHVFFLGCWHAMQSNELDEAIFIHVGNNVAELDLVDALCHALSVGQS